jgi:hypothetical protein
MMVTKENLLEGPQLLAQVEEVLAQAQRQGTNQLLLLGYEP